MSKSILIVEDTWQVRNLIKKVVGHLFSDYEVLDVENVVEALSVLETVTPCLVITDLDMPDLSGFDLIDLMQENPAVKEVPVIIVTSFADHKDDKSIQYRLKSMGLPVCPVASKPLDMEDFRAKVADALNC